MRNLRLASLFVCTVISTHAYAARSILDLSKHELFLPVVMVGDTKYQARLAFDGKNQFTLIDAAPTDQTTDQPVIYDPQSGQATISYVDVPGQHWAYRGKMQLLPGTHKMTFALTSYSSVEVLPIGPEITYIAHSPYDHTTCQIERQGMKCWRDGSPLAIPVTLTNPRQVSIGASKTICALDDGGVKCWTGSVDKQRNVPSDLAHPRQVSVGDYHICALDDVGVKCWGNNEDGQINVPKDLTNPRQISAGDSHTCALDDKGVRCWGSLTDAPNDLVNPRQISSGAYHTCALDDTGIKCWGDNTFGVTTPPPDLVNPRQISSGGFTTCALDDEGVKCWGRLRGRIDASLDLADPRQITVGNRYVCVLDNNGNTCWNFTDPPEGTPSQALLVNPRQLSQETADCAIDDEGIKCWFDLSGKLDEEFPIPLTNLMHPRQIAGNSKEGCLLDEEGVKCWSYRTNFITEVPKNLSNPRQIAVGDFHACALNDKAVQCWGDNSLGQALPPTDLVSPSQISAGGNYTCVLDKKGVKCWGKLLKPSIRKPLEIIFHEMPDTFNNPQAVTVSRYYACVLEANNVKCWGYYFDNIEFNNLINPRHISVGSLYLYGKYYKPYAPPNGDDISVLASRFCVIDDEGLKCKTCTYTALDPEKDPCQPIHISDSLVHPQQLGVADTLRTCVLDAEGVKCLDGATVRALPTVMR